MTMITTRTRALALALVLAGCGTSDPCRENPFACYDGGTGAGGSCDDLCDFSVPEDWQGPYMLWSGPDGATPPMCLYDWYHSESGWIDALPTTMVCPQCYCTPSAVQCGLPTLLYANQAACPAGGSAPSPTAVSMPPGWAGTCLPIDGVSAAGSVTVDALDMIKNSSRCYAQPNGPRQVEGGTIAQLCYTTVEYGETLCTLQRRMCAAVEDTAGPPVCISHVGEVACLEGFPKRHLFYHDENICGCTCGDPMGASCSTTVTVHEDGACATPLASITVSDDAPTCGDLTPGSKIGSQSATVPTYTAGVCEPRPREHDPVTLCCLR